jgi:hypothetical protein
MTPSDAALLVRTPAFRRGDLEHLGISKSGASHSGTPAGTYSVEGRELPFVRVRRL